MYKTVTSFVKKTGYRFIHNNKTCLRDECPLYSIVFTMKNLAEKKCTKIKRINC